MKNGSKKYNKEKYVINFSTIFREHYCGTTIKNVNLNKTKRCIFVHFNWAPVDYLTMNTNRYTVWQGTQIPLTKTKRATLAAVIKVCCFRGCHVHVFTYNTVPLFY